MCGWCNNMSVYITTCVCTLPIVKYTQPGSQQVLKQAIDYKVIYPPGTPILSAVV